MKIPPKIGPMALANAHVKPTKARYTPRSLCKSWLWEPNRYRGKSASPYLTATKSDMVTFTKPTSPPAPRPCTALPAMTVTIFWATAQRMLPTRKIVHAINRTGFLPNMSLFSAVRSCSAQELDIMNAPEFTPGW